MGQARYNYHSVIPTNIFMEYINMRIKECTKRTFDLDDNPLYRQQGRGQLLEELLNLPEVLTAMDESEEDT